MLINADNYSATAGYTSSGWVPASAVTGFIHLQDTAASGGFSTAFEANTNNLWNIDANGNGDLRLGMMPGTSPSITKLAGGGYQIAFQANTGHLWTTGTAARRTGASG